jgi:Fe-S cluster assembly ATP-binding protein
MLEINQLQVSVNEKQVLHAIQLRVLPGTVHAIMGPNGSGKSSLAYTLIGHSHYTVTGGSIQMSNQDITSLSPDKRAQAGLFLSFQQPPAIPGVNIMTFLKEAHYAITGTVHTVAEFNALVDRYRERLHINPALVHRNLNEGFSGGEKKQLEMLQLLLLKPKIAILDEIDSGLDIDALKAVAHGLQYAREENPSLSLLLITHYQRILAYVVPDYVHILCDGKLVKSGDISLVTELEAKGYHGYRHTQI